MGVVLPGHYQKDAFDQERGLVFLFVFVFLADIAGVLSIAQASFDSMAITLVRRLHPAAKQQPVSLA